MNGCLKALPGFDIHFNSTYFAELRVVRIKKFGTEMIILSLIAGLGIDQPEFLYQWT